jgi:hypothetical protein
MSHRRIVIEFEAIADTLFWPLRPLAAVATLTALTTRTWLPLACTTAFATPAWPTLSTARATWRWPLGKKFVRCQFTVSIGIQLQK